MKHFLVVYNQTQSALLQLREFDDATRALEARFKAELEFDQSSIEVVVLTAESIEAARRTHSRYFEDLSELLEDSTLPPADPR